MNEKDLCLSTRAIRIYDQRGEKAMIEFLLRKEVRQAEPDEEEMFVMEDGSQICIGPPGGEYQDGETGQSRPVTLEIPRHFPMRMPVLARPNAGDVLDALLVRARAVRGESAPGLYEALGSGGLRAAALRAVSLANQEVRTGRQSANPSGLLERCTEIALEQMGPEERQLITGEDEK